MGAREWLLSVLFVGFVALKVVEGACALESWPLSHVPMFAEPQPESRQPMRLAIYARRGDVWFEMRPFMLGLNPDELGRQLLGEIDPGPRCGMLIDAFNAARPAPRRVSAAYLQRSVLARPGTDQVAFERYADCPLRVAAP